jgi:3-polyprenyl-4-hydroxybenzoate decarboxylase
MPVLMDQRAAIEFSKEAGECLIIQEEISPAYEIASITKAFDGGPLLIFENIKGYPKWKAVTNLLSRRERIAKYFDASIPDLSKRIIEAIRNPLPPRIVKDPPCQENVILSDISIAQTLPILTQTKIDAGPVLSGGALLVNYPEEMGYGPMTFNLSFHRLGLGTDKDWLTLATLYNRHFLEVLHYHKSKGSEFPITINFGLSPALNILSSGGAFPQIRASGSDDLGVAGNLQGTPVRIAHARTTNAYCIADAELVLEGKVLYEEKDVAEVKQGKPKDLSKPQKRPDYFFPEFIGYEGFCDRAFRFQVTAITFRENPYYYTPLADSLESSNLGAVISEASVYNACKNTAPNIFLNCHILDGMRGILGAAIQCKIDHEMQFGISQNLINAALGAIKDLKWVIAVDEDIDIYDPTDIIWALTVRTRADEDINVIKGAGLGNIFATKWSVDTTVPVQDRWRALRPHFEAVDLKKWLSEDDISRGLSLMNEGARSVAKRRV